RDVHTGLYPLTYSSPISKVEYLGGRFLAAFVLNALILLGVQLGSLLAAYAPGGNPDIIGPFRPAAYLAAYTSIALTNAFIAATFQFSAALLSGRPIASYVGSVALFFLSYPVTFTLYLSGLGERGLLADPIGIMAIMNEMMSKWTIVEKNVRMFTLEGPMLWNRLLWLGIACLTLAFIYRRFRFEHRVATPWWSRRRVNVIPSEARNLPSLPTLSGRQIPRFARDDIEGRARHDSGGRAGDDIRSFGLATNVRQMLSIARLSFWTIAKTPAGLFLLVAFPMFLVLVMTLESEHWGIPLVPRTGYLLSKHLTAPLTQATDFR